MGMGRLAGPLSGCGMAALMSLPFLSRPALAAADPPLIRVGVSGGMGLPLVSTVTGTTGFSWSLEIDGEAPGIGESGLGFRELRLQRDPASQPILFRQVRLRSSVAAWPETGLVASWQGGVTLQDIPSTTATPVATNPLNAANPLGNGKLGGQLGARLDWHVRRQFSPYLGAMAIFGNYTSGPAATGTATGTAAAGGNAFGAEAIGGFASRWPITINWGDERYTAELGGKAEVYYWYLLDEHLVGLDLRIGAYF
jgi:hypothetical protein